MVNGTGNLLSRLALPVIFVLGAAVGLGVAFIWVHFSTLLPPVIQRTVGVIIAIAAGVSLALGPIVFIKTELKLPQSKKRNSIILICSILVVLLAHHFFILEAGHRMIFKKWLNQPVPAGIHISELWCHGFLDAECVLDMSFTDEEGLQQLLRSFDPIGPEEVRERCHRYDYYVQPELLQQEDLQTFAGPNISSAGTTTSGYEGSKTEHLSPPHGCLFLSRAMQRAVWLYY